MANDAEVQLAVDQAMKDQKKQKRKKKLIIFGVILAVIVVIAFLSVILMNWAGLRADRKKR